jgi:hypothetical protein
LVPVRFENLVWFRDQELLAKLHERVPLFRGTLPPAGRLQDEVSDALQDLLTERGVQGRADYLRAGPDEGPVEAIVFSVRGPVIRIRKVEFSSAAPPELASLQELGKDLRGQDYLRSTLKAQAEKNFLPVYFAHGYLKATIADAEAQLVQDGPHPSDPRQNPPQQNPPQTNVDVTFQVNPGRQYALAGTEWSGNTIFPLDKLQPLIHSQTGQPLDAVRLSHDLQAVEKLYGTRGYVTAKVQSTEQFDEDRLTVSYRLQVQEGDLYHMGDLEVQGLDDHDAGRVLAKWGLHKDQTYDGSYPRHFVDDGLKGDALGQDWNVIIHEFPDPKDKTVDVTLRFDRKSPEL